MSDLLTFIDDIIDNNEVPADMTLHQYLSRTAKYNSRCKRQFGGVRNALEEYGYYTEPQEDWTNAENMQQIAGSIRIGNDYKPYLVGTEAIKWTKELRNLRDSLIIEKYLAETEFWEVNKFQRRNGAPQHPVDGAVRNIYGTWKKFYKAIGYYPNIGESLMKITAKEGREFEAIVEAVLTQVYERCPATQKRVRDCVPDFMIGDIWFDAKRSRSTALGPSCETIEKYRKHTDYLTIIYALHDTEECDERANFVCITEYYPYITAELRRKCDEFIAKAQRTTERGRGYRCKKIS